MSNTFVSPWIVARLAPPSMGFSRQEYWSELPFPSPGDLPNPGIKPVFLVLQTDSLPGKLMPAHDYVQKQEEKHTFFFSLGWNAFLNRFLCTAHLPELGSPSISKCISAKNYPKMENTRLFSTFLRLVDLSSEVSLMFDHYHSS